MAEVKAKSQTLRPFHPMDGAHQPPPLVHPDKSHPPFILVYTNHHKKLQQLPMQTPVSSYTHNALLVSCSFAMCSGIHISKKYPICSNSSQQKNPVCPTILHLHAHFTLSSSPVPQMPLEPPQMSAVFSPPTARCGISVLPPGCCF